MTPDLLYRRLIANGLTVRVEAGALLVSPRANLTDGLAADIRENKGGLLAYLEPPAAVEWLLDNGEIVQSTRPACWYAPSAAISWRPAGGVNWQALACLPAAWGLAAAHDPAYDPFRRARVTKHGTCYNCGGVDFWTSRLWADVVRCRICVPPAPGAESEGVKP